MTNSSMKTSDYRYCINIVSLHENLGSRLKIL